MKATVFCIPTNIILFIYGLVSLERENILYMAYISLYYNIISEVKKRIYPTQTNQITLIYSQVAVTLPFFGKQE